MQSVFELITRRLPIEGVAMAAVGLVRPPWAVDAGRVWEGESEYGFE